MVREIITQLDVAQESRDLTDEELSLHGDLKCHSLGLASFTWMIVRHCSHIRFLEQGDANTKFFHLQAYHRNYKNHVPSILHEGQWFSAKDAKEEVIYNNYKDILGTAFQRLTTGEPGFAEC